MPEFNPTPSQQNAIDSRDRTVLVSAGAGSGKTRVLTERLMRYIAEPGSTVDVDSFVIISFTRASAAELRGRIMKAISDEIEKQPDNAHLRRQSALCNRAMICTIDSFCTSLLREFSSSLITLQPDFQVLDESRAEAMKREVIDRVLTECYEDSEVLPGFRLLADTLGAGHTDARLAALVTDLHAKMQCHPYPDAWAQETIRGLAAGTDDISGTFWYRILMEDSVSLLNSCIDRIEQLLVVFRDDPAYAAANTGVFLDIEDAFRGLSRAAEQGWDPFRSALDSCKLPNRKKAKDADPATNASAKVVRDVCGKALEKLKKRFRAPAADVCDVLRKTAPLMVTLLRLTEKFDEAYALAKRQNSLADFSDLSHEVVRMLTAQDRRPTELAKQISLRYKEIMVDEFQDINRVQELIFEAVSRDGKNLFFVGDAKQSIYRFRLADPTIFTSRYKAYPPYAAAAPGEAAKIELAENFRSRREVLDACNAVFSRCMSPELGDIDYDDATSLKLGADYHGSVEKPELLLLDLPKEQTLSADNNRQTLEARMVAEKILGLFRDGTTIETGGSFRKIEYGDIAVLFRAANATGKLYRKVFEEYGIPVSSGQPCGFFASPEVSWVTALLSIIDNPHKDIPLLTVLQSPIFRFSPDELSEIRLANKQADFFDAMCAAAPSQEKAAGFLEALARYRRLAPDLRMCDLVWQLITELNLQAICSAMPAGEQRCANLMEFIDLSNRYERSGYRGLHRFVLWLAQLAEKDEIVVPGSSGSAVTMLSIHRSKGLEFPVVFIADAEKPVNIRDSTEPVLVHPEYGLAPSYIDLDRRIKYPTAAREAIAIKLRAETFSEEMRLLYVAMTRAKERLFITAAFPDAHQKYEDALHRYGGAVTIPPRDLTDARCYAKWVLYAAVMDGEEHLKVSVCSLSGSAPDAGVKAQSCEGDAGSLQVLREQLDFAYPYAASVLLPSKLTATELKRREPEDEDAARMIPSARAEFRMPALRGKAERISSAERGTATHLVLQYIDFSKTATMEEIDAEIRRLRDGGFLTGSQADSVDRRSVLNLFSSALGRRMVSADREGTVRREFGFHLLCPASDFIAEADTSAVSDDDRVLLQGVVDCFFECGGTLTVVDYKTDRVSSPELLQSRVGVYTKQVKTYAQALERVFQMPVGAAYLYFLDISKEVRIL